MASPTVTHLGPLDAPTVKATYDLPLMCHSKKYGMTWDNCSPQGGIPFVNGEPQNVWQASLDLWTDPPTIWLDPGITSDYGPWACSYERAMPMLLTPRDGKLVVKRDFGKDVKRMLGLPFEPPSVSIAKNAPLAFNPKSGLLYAGYWHSAADKYDVMFSFRQALAIDPDSGKIAPVDLPLATSDLCFDMDGYAYLRRPTLVARFEPSNWREVPWDYGEESPVGFDGCGVALVGGLRVPGYGAKPQGGLYVSPRGNIIVPCYATNVLGLHYLDMGGQPINAVEANVGKPYEPQMYLGRAGGKQASTLHVFNNRGKVVAKDVVKGLMTTKGVGLDRDDNIYLMHSSNRMVDGKPYLRQGTGTLIKFKRDGGKIYSETGTPLPLESQPKQPPDLLTLPGLHGKLWVEGPQWYFGGGGDFGVTNRDGCLCTQSNFTLDLFARSFVPEHDHFTVAVLDTNGNVMMRIGQYGNCEDGKPLIADNEKIPPGP
jgi:hypothetical protein